jgi:ATP-dependent protease HslVU (ClpYQ) peptidase subunit
MTTVAADARKGVMVADTMVSDGDVKSKMTKIIRHGDELIGVAGELCQVEPWLKWYRSGMRGRKPRSGTFSALVLGPSGLAHYEGTDKTTVEQEFFAIGSGGKAALALMHAGHSCQESVEVTCLVDANSSLPVQVEYLSGVCQDSHPVTQ